MGSYLPILNIEIDAKSDPTAALVADTVLDVYLSDPTEKTTLDCSILWDPEGKPVSETTRSGETLDCRLIGGRP